MEDMLFQNTAPTASSLSRDISHEGSMPSLPSRNMMLSKKDWEDLKSTIRELYLDRGQTLKQLAKYMEEHHRFKPTKKQLIYHISGWGFEKNVKKSERRALLERHGAKIGEPDVASQVHRGRKLDKAKLNRWIRLEKSLPNGSIVRDNQVSDHSVALRDLEVSTQEQNPRHDEQSGVLPPEEESEIVSSRSMDNAFYWNSVDVVGSPRLTKLIGALTIEECDIPSLDLDINMHEVEDILGQDLLDLCKRDDSAEEERNAPTSQAQSARFSVLMKPSHMFEKCTQHIWQYELYPFSTSPSPSHAGEVFCSGISFRPKMSDLECRRKLGNLNHLTDAEVIHLVQDMEAEAVHRYSLGYWDGAETWFRRIVTAKQKVKWYQPQQTLSACVIVIECMVLQDRHKEAQQLHKDFHVKVERLLGVDHHICLNSREVLAGLHQKFGFQAESESIRREVLQSRLTTLGTRHPDTIRALHNIARALEPLGRYRAEAQHLLEIILRFQLESLKSTGYTEMKGLRTMQTIARLADAFNSDGRYDESENLWNYAQKLLRNATKTACLQTFEYYYRRAHGYRLQRRFDESEKILRGLLGHHEKSMYPSMTRIVIVEFTKVLMETSRQREAKAWLKKLYFLFVKGYGPAHSYTMSYCARVANCLAGLRRHHEARLYFGEVLEVLASSDDDQMGSRVKCIQDVNGWMLNAEKMMMEDSMEKFSKSGNSEGEWSDTDEDDEDDKDMDDIFDPLCDS